MGDGSGGDAPARAQRSAAAAAAEPHAAAGATEGGAGGDTAAQQQLLRREEIMREMQKQALELIMDSEPSLARKLVKRTGAARAEAAPEIS